MSKKERSNKFTLAFTGGGTGGHVFPGLSIISHMKNRMRQREEGYNDLDIYWIGSKSGIERQYVENHGITYAEVYTGKLRRYVSLQNIIDPVKIILGIIQSIKLFQARRPQLVVSIGGYVSVPCVLAAQFLNIPIISICCDYSLGLASKITLKYSHFILCAYKDTAESLQTKTSSQKIFSGISKKRSTYFSTHNIDVESLGLEAPYSIQSWVIHCGMPLRYEIFNSNPEALVAKYKINKDRKLILVLGGSMGSSQINQMLVRILPQLDESIIVVHQYGSLELEECTQSHRCRYIPIRFIEEEYSSFLSRADLVIARAGAGTLWEIIANACPSLIIPLSKSNSRGDQIENAQYFSLHNAIINLGTDPKDSDIIEAIERVLCDQEIRSTLVAACKKFELTHVVDHISRIIYLYNK